MARCPSPWPRPADGLLPPIDAVSLRDRLVPPFLGSRWVGWAGPIGVTILGFILRVWGAGSPHDILFDEIYYVHDSINLHEHGVELRADQRRHDRRSTSSTRRSASG